MKDLPPIDEDTEEAWIPTGARLEDVYWRLEESHKIIAGGGCKSVNVGGLAFPIDYRPCSGCEPERPCPACSIYETRLAQVISDYIEKNPVDPNVKSYISLYSMGGAIADQKPGASAFWYRQKKFVIQIESWWNYPDSREEACRADEKWQEPYVEWVRSFRETLRAEGLIEGAFINFIDRDLKEYYGGNFERLKQLKSEWDPSDFFGFEMGIPRG